MTFFFVYTARMIRDLLPNPFLLAAITLITPLGLLGCGADAEQPNKPEPTTPAIAVGLGNSHSCAILETGEARCWGSNSAGQLGDGTLISSLSPVIVKDLSGLVAIGGGHEHTCALRNDGTVFCWGDNEFGQLGDGTTAAANLPGQVKDLQDVVEIAVGWVHSCARLKDGTMKCWGAGEGRIGDGSTENHLSPITVPGMMDVVSIGAGWGHSCGLSSAGTAKCWGTYNAWGQIGDGTTTDTIPTPVDVLDLKDGATIRAGSYHTCSMTKSSGLRCWGNDQASQISGILVGGDFKKATLIDELTDVAEVSTGGFHTCSRQSSGQVLCWGNLEFNGNGLAAGRVEVPGIAASQIASGGDQACALDKEKQVWCWGVNGSGQLGNGTATNPGIPVKVLFP